MLTLKILSSIVIYFVIGAISVRIHKVKDNLLTVADEKFVLFLWPVSLSILTIVIFVELLYKIAGIKDY